MIDTLLDVTLLAFLTVTTFAIVHMRNLFAVIMLFGIFSLLSAGLFVIMDAADVAFTEAAVGAGISTVLMLATLALLRHPHPRERTPSFCGPLPVFVVVLTGAVLIYGTLDIPGYGDPMAPSQTHVAPEYIARGYAETGVPNLVTAVLASYRGFDTLGEVTVIFTAGVGVLLLIGSRRNRRNDGEDPP